MYSAKSGILSLAMEDFLASPNTPLDTALKNLRDSDLMILVIGFRAGSSAAGRSECTYTSAEYEELLRLGKEAARICQAGSGEGETRPSIVAQRRTGSGESKLLSTSSTNASVQEMDLRQFLVGGGALR